jgi:hypothetical protein
MPSYEVRSTARDHKVLRIGPKGGVRLIATYPNAHSAQAVADELNKWRGIER